MNDFSGGELPFHFDERPGPALLALLTDPLLTPLFTPAPRSGVRSGWYGHVPFARWIVEALRPRRLVELGTHNGVSYAAFCEAVKDAGLDAKCFAVDTWEGDEHAGMYGEDVYESLRRFHDARYSAFSEMVRSTFDDALDYFRDGSIDLLHIDGCHSYDQVRHDFERWKPKLTDRAVVLLHDTNVRERNFGVWRFWAELRQEHPGFEFLHEHGLGVLGYGANLPEPVRTLTGLRDEETITAIRSRFAFSGRCCITESEVATLRDEVVRQRSMAGEVERLTGALNDTHKLAQAIADERDAVRAEAAPAQREGSRLRLIASRAVDSANAMMAADAERKRGLVAQADHDRTVILNLEEQLCQERAVRANLHTAQGSLLNQIEALELQAAALQQSTLWKMTWPLRQVAQRVPGPMRSAARRTLAGAWGATRMLRWPKQLPPPSPAAAPAPAPDEVPGRALVPAAAPYDRFSLHQLPPLHGDYSSAVAWYDAETPEVSIIVLNWNRSEMTLLCLQHIWQRTRGRRYEILIVDNGSSHEDLQRLRREAALARLIPLGTNRYFGEANNIGVEKARGRYICLLNNDAFVHDGWLEPMVAMLESDARIGAVGPRFLYPDGVLQEAGAMTSPDGSVIQLGKWQDANAPETRTARPVDYVSAACTVMRRQDFLDVLGFDLMWDPAYYEDSDLGLKLRLKHLQTYYCPESTVTHVEGATSSDSGKALQLNNIVAINRVKFANRWGEFLRTNGAHKPDLLPPARPARARTGDKRLLVYTPYNLTPGGGERYLLTITEALAPLGLVALVTPQPFSRIRVLTMAREFGLNLDHLELLTTDELAEQAPFDLAFIMGNEIVPPIGRVATTNIYYCQFPFPIESESYFRQHRPYLFDMALVVNSAEYVRGHVLRLLREMALPERQVEVLPPPVPILDAPATKRRQIMHVGRFFTGGHCKRQDLLLEAFRGMVERGLEAELHFAGSIPPDAQHRAYYTALVDAAAGLPVFFHPNCPTAEIAELYRSSSVYWHATGLGHDILAEPHKAEHFGISVVEAMSAGCVPIVFAAGGPLDIVADQRTGFHFHDTAELCERTLDVLDRMPEAEVSAMRQAASAAAAGYDEATFRAHVLEIAGRFLTAEASPA